MKKLTFSKPKKIKKSTLKNKADRLFSLIVRSRGYCELKGLDDIKCSSVLQCAHIETRGVLGIRWEEDNALCICSGHHWWHTNHEKIWQEKIQAHFPNQWSFYEAHRNDHMNETYQEVITRLTKRLQELETHEI
jgi:hypothetical protein